MPEALSFHRSILLVRIALAAARLFLFDVQPIRSPLSHTVFSRYFFRIFTNPQPTHSVGVSQNFFSSCTVIWLLEKDNTYDPEQGRRSRDRRRLALSLLCLTGGLENSFPNPPLLFTIIVRSVSSPSYYSCHKILIIYGPRFEWWPRLRHVDLNIRDQYP